MSKSIKPTTVHATSTTPLSSANAADAPLPRLLFDHHDGTSFVQPLAEGILVGVNWKAIEAVKGTKNWAGLESDIASASKYGQKAVLRFSPYMGKAADAVDHGFPDWIWNEGVEKITFADKRGINYSIPKCWNSPAWQKVWGDFITAVAAKYGSDPRVAAIQVGYGHLGLMTCQPSTDSEAALAAAKWNPEDWRVYLDWATGATAAAFPLKKIIATGSVIFTTTCAKAACAPYVAAALNHAISLGGAVMLSGVDVLGDIQPIIDAMGPSAPSIFIGRNDWPLTDIPKTCTNIKTVAGQLNAAQTGMVLLADDFTALSVPANKAAVESVCGPLQGT